jgi:hypothetical protein
MMKIEVGKCYRRSDTEELVRITNSFQPLGDTPLSSALSGAPRPRFRCNLGYTYTENGVVIKHRDRGLVRTGESFYLLPLVSKTETSPTAIPQVAEGAGAINQCTVQSTIGIRPLPFGSREYVIRDGRRVFRMIYNPFEENEWEELPQLPE